jgi:hypothetical protein
MGSRRVGLGNEREVCSGGSAGVPIRKQLHGVRLISRHATHLAVIRLEITAVFVIYCW